MTQGGDNRDLPEEKTGSKTASKNAEESETRDLPDAPYEDVDAVETEPPEPAEAPSEEDDRSVGVEEDIGDDKTASEVSSEIEAAAVADEETGAERSDETVGDETTGDEAGETSDNVKEDDAIEDPAETESGTIAAEDVEEDTPDNVTPIDADKDDFGVSKEVVLSRLESLIFTSPDPISVRKLARILNLEGKVVRELLGELSAFYADRGIILEEVSKGFQFRSNPENASLIRDVFKLKPLRISRAALETLSIVAYRQPLTRAEAEQIRGVDCGGVLKYLFEKNLVRVIGRKDEPGRPIIYGTTNEFLALFGLKALSDLPALHEFSELWDEHQKIVDEETPLAEDTEGTTLGGEGGDTSPGPDSEEDASVEGENGGDSSEEVPDTMSEAEKKKEETNQDDVPTESINHSVLEALMQDIDTSDLAGDDDSPEAVVNEGNEDDSGEPKDD